MSALTSRERIDRILKRAPVDRIGGFEHFWKQTIDRWTAEGRLQPSEPVEDHFGLDIVQAHPFHVAADLTAQPVVVEETDSYIVYRDGNAALMRREKQSDDPPRVAGFTIRSRRDWEEAIKQQLTACPERIKFEEYREARRRAEAGERCLCIGSRLTFQAIELICGHEFMLIGMAADPDWFRDMADTYAAMWMGCMEILFAREGKPDLVWFNEDLGFKERPFMSPAMYRELIQPVHRRVFDFVHALGLPVMLHSCGMVEALLPDLIEAGIDGLQAIEVKAGMDPLRIKRSFGDRITLCGGMNALALVKNDRAGIRHELAGIPELMRGSGYILHSDHSITPQVDYDTYRFFLEEGLAVGAYG